MIRLILSLLLLTLATLNFSCDRAELELQEKDEYSVVKIHSITEKAILSYIHSRKSESTRSDISPLIPITVDNDTVLFVKNYNGGGFEVFSNSVNLPMKLIKSKKGYFYPDESQAGDFLNEYVSNLAGSLHKKVGNLSETKEPVGLWRLYIERENCDEPPSRDPSFVGMAVEAKENVYTPKGGRLKTKWHQRYPYNNYAPYSIINPTEHAPIGCGSVAIGQYLKFCNSFWGFPKYTLSKVEYDSENNKYNFYGQTETLWELIDDGSNGFLDSTIQKEATSLFLGSIFRIIGSSIGEGGSDPKKEKEYLNNQLNSNYDFVDFNVKDAISILKRGFPVYVQSSGKMYGDDVERVIDHSYLIDFAEVIELSYFEIFTESDLIIDPEIEEPDTGEYGPDLEFYKSIYGEIYPSFDHSEIECWVSMNWGWGGKYDDLYIYVFDTNWVVNNADSKYFFNNHRILQTL